MKYRKRPVEVEAFQWFLHMGEVGGVRNNPSGNPMMKDWHIIETLEGWLTVSSGDWIITDRGGKRPCKPDKFAESYEPMVDEA